MTIFVLFIETRGVVSIPVENRFGVHSGNADLPRHTPSGTAEQLYDWRGGGGGGAPLVTQYWGAQDTFSL